MQEFKDGETEQHRPEVHADGNRLEQMERSLSDHAKLIEAYVAKLGELDALVNRLKQELATATASLRKAKSDAKVREAEISRLIAMAAQERNRNDIAENTLRILQERERSQQTLIDSLQVDGRRHHNTISYATKQLVSIRGSTSFRLGSVLIAGFSSWSGLVNLPRQLYRILRSVWNKRQSRVQTPLQGPIKVGLPALLDTMRLNGIEAAQSLAAQASSGDMREHAAMLAGLSRYALSSGLAAGIDIARKSYELDPRPFRAKSLAFILSDQGAIAEPLALLNSLPIPYVAQLKPSERTRRGRLLGLARLKAGAIIVPAKAERDIKSVSRRSLYIAATAMPFHLAGYTRRTQLLVRETRRLGWDVRLLGRPGYPADRSDSLSEEEGQRLRLGDVEPTLLDGPSIAKTPADEWILEAALAIEKKASELKPSLIHAASNWQNALPALIAARRLGIPFVYEVRGFWDLTKASGNPNWAKSEEHEVLRAMETLVSCSADRLVTLSPRMAVECELLGVDSARISVVPNASDMTFVPPERAAEVRASLGLDPRSFVIGYAGALVHYEGVDDLIRALQLIVESGVDARAVIAGDGKARDEIERLATELGIRAKVHFLGAVAPDIAEQVLAASDVVVLPRKSFAVTELVEPLKPLEAMAVGRPLVVSDVRPLRELIEASGNGLSHRPGDYHDLAKKILLLEGDKDLRAELSQKGRAFVEKSRRWNTVSRELTAIWDETCEGRQENTSKTTRPIALADRIPKPNDAIVMLSGDARAFTTEQQKQYVRLATDASKQGIKELRSLVERQSAGRAASFRAKCLVIAASAARRAEEHTEEIILLNEAVALSGEPSTWRPLARALWYRGELDRADALILLMKVAERNKPSIETATLATAIAQRRVLMVHSDKLLETHAVPNLPYEAVADKVAYFLHFTLPYASNGYATRSHGLIQGIQNAGTLVAAYSRAGFPTDLAGFRDLKDVPLADVVDGVTYNRVLEGNRVNNAELDYILNSADAYERILRKERPSVVHAASNYTTGLPALIAARRVGRPFVYEVRGFWEMTRASRVTDFEQNPQFAMMEQLEGLVAREADHVVTLTSGMRDQLVTKGVSAQKITIAPNGVDPDHFHNIPRDESLAAELGLSAEVPVIGYIGSVVSYEGLDDLVNAVAALRDAGKVFRLLLVGDGAALPALRDLIESRKLADRVIIAGRVPHEAVTRYYSLIDICPFPRKPIPLCEMVSPLKPFEAMAMEKTVLVSDVRALTDIVTDGVNGVTFCKGSVTDLARALGRLIDDSNLRSTLAKAGRAWVQAERNWNKSGSSIATVYRSVLRDWPGCESR